MTKSKNTKRALLMSVLSMMLCIAMLVGSTFAWFTDTVTSGKNKIVAGNLDVELEYATFSETVNDDGETETVTTWRSVEGAEDIFGDIKLWEPGTTGVAYFRLSNLGTLALKYRLAMNFTDTVIGKNADGGDIKLSEILEFGIVEGQEETFASREDAIAAVTNAQKVSEGYSPDEMSMGVTDEKNYFALVVYMPTTTGNEANYRGTAIPQIDLGINLVATQDTVENDSFGTDYDENAEYPVIPTKVATTDEFVAAIGNGEDVALTEDIALTDIVNVTNDVTIYANGKTITNAASRLLWADNDDVTVTIVNANLVSTNTGNGSRGVQINANRSNVDLIVKDSTITMNNVADNYGVNICGGVTGGSLTLKNCEITAYQCVNIYGSDMTVNIEGCTFTYVNTHNKGWSGGFITLFCGGGCENVALTVKNTQFITGTVADGYAEPKPPVYHNGCDASDSDNYTITVEGCAWNGAAYTYTYCNE